ncbi:MAG: GrpB family protein [Halanaerobiaceae bacterium]|jgi:GrpB-like predicted nucleotidyltransferase (UPF0157 family)|nr:GrpB family protein [Halanaerobiaceae bacterium]
MKKQLSEMTLEELWQLFPIILREYNPEYKEWYLQEEENIKKVLVENEIKRISHIGSTAVEGLVAKPIVDILLEINENCVIENIKEKLKEAGWILMSTQSSPDFKMVFNKGYTPDGFADKVFHLHVRFSGDWGELYFRDYLQSHKEVAREYGELKQRLQQEYKHNRDGYTEAKTEFINKWTKEARKVFANRYTP